MSEKKIKNISITSTIAVLAGLICAGALGYMAYQSRHFIKIEKYEKDVDIARLEEKVATLENMLRQMSVKEVKLSDVAALNQKVDQMHQINIEALNAKVNAVAFVGLIERLDKIEYEISDLSKTTSPYALILTAAALTESAAKTGHPFVYEASVLQNLSEGTRMQQSADIIASYAIKGLQNKDQLIDSFNNLYVENFAKPASTSTAQKEVENTDSDSSDWTEQMLNKLKSLVIVEKTDDTDDASEYVTDAVYALVQDGDFEGAIVKMNAEPKYQTEAFGIWAEETRAEKNFEEQLNKIRALTLGLMKANELTEKTAQ